MAFWTLLQILAHVVTFAILVYVLFSLRRPAKDDPRLSRGLQLLQSKIAVLEDLSDRTDTQVQQLQALLSQRSKDVETLLQRLEAEMARVQQAMKKSLEVAEIFQDRIPHKEIIERQTTTKYVRAAQLAHAGKSVEEIARAVDLSVGEIELIAKLNRERLQFSEAELPEWIQKESSKRATAENNESLELQIEEPLLLKETPAGLAQLGEKMRQALQSQASSVQPGPSEFVMQAPAASNSTTEPSAPGSTMSVPSAEVAGPTVKPYAFPRVSIRDSLA
jgi:hypothetical protein